MAFFAAADRDDFHRQLDEALAPRLEAAERAALGGLARALFAGVALDELAERRLADLAGCCLSAWQLLARFDPAQPQVRLFDPDYAHHGWQSPHSVLLVLHPDMPFLVDSLRIELRRRGLAVHSVQNCVLALRRDADGRLGELLDAGAPQANSREALICLEIDRCAGAGERHLLVQALHEVFADVRLAVGDYAPMRARLGELLDPLGEGDAELRAFLQWLRDDHFVFLGYEEFRVEDAGDGGGLLVYDEATLLGLSRRLRAGLDAASRRVSAAAMAWLRSPQRLACAKAERPTRVHRAVYPDYLSLRELDAAGQVRRECRFLGLYTTPVYGDSVRSIPWLRAKVAEVLRRSGFAAGSHLGKSLLQVLEDLPRDDLLQSEAAELGATALAIVQIQERNRLRLFLRRDPLGQFCYALVYVPRERYSAEIRARIQQLLVQRLAASDCEQWTEFSASLLARLQFILRVDPLRPPAVELRGLEQALRQACRSWQDDYAALLGEAFGEARGRELLGEFAAGLPAAYCERCAPAQAVADLRVLLDLDAARPLQLLLVAAAQPGGEPRGRLYHLQSPLALADILPVFDNLGLRVLGEFSHCLRRAGGRACWIHELNFAPLPGVELAALAEPLQEAFLQVLQGAAENDGFNRLVLAAGLGWREVALLRAYGRYLKQVRLGFDLGYVAATLAAHARIAAELVRLFKVRFHLAQRLPVVELADKQQRLEQAILAALERVAVLNEDRILRRYLELMRATLRCNFYRSGPGGRARDCLSFKLDPRQIAEMPLPLPRYEIFVYSPRVEGVHLRGGKVARGGVRWSEREEDYRSEVLGLAKAQQVKNAVIVPLGAKGGFVARRLPGGPREAQQGEALACYRLFIAGLLDLTDNLVDGQVVPPAQVVRYDDDDPYLVVAADKGTASFSDSGNAVAAEYRFWLGDAFASGGSAGYDHKGMGITARGAWVAVQRHFRELGVDLDRQCISVVGIGDMSGDVFGNGLLRSPRVQLVAAFDHRHIFLDPDPDPAASFAERRRLFALPRSSWADYAADLLSPGGGVYPRDAKSIALSPQARARLGIAAERLTPAELIAALLRAPVDLLWNGGIGTYVKASRESHLEVGDKANDGVRVDARELRCKVVGEGGNLGMTPLARVEYCLHGGACNGDFIDNAGGVTCSDLEVNIKILLDEVVRAGDLTRKQRDALLHEMSEAVAERVLAVVYRQTQTLSLAQRYAHGRLGEFRRLLADLESRGRLDRGLEGLPGDDELNARVARGQGLTRAELALLLAHGKLDLKEALLHSPLVDEAYLRGELRHAFPAPLVERFAAALEHHRLRREIVATQLASELIDRLGLTAVQRLHESTGLSAAHIAAGWVVVRDLLDLPRCWQQLEALDRRIDAELQLALMEELMRLARRAVRWLLRSRRQELDMAADVAHFAAGVGELAASFGELLEGEARRAWLARCAELEGAGVPAELARLLAGCGQLHTLLALVDAAESTGQPPLRVAACHFAVGAELELGWYQQQLNGLPADSHWQALARESLRDELDAQQRAITVAVLQMAEGPLEIDNRLTLWLARHQPLVARWRQMLAELRAAGSGDYSMYTVANRELQDLAQSAQNGEGIP